LIETLNDYMQVATNTNHVTVDFLRSEIW